LIVYTFYYILLKTYCEKVLSVAIINDNNNYWFFIMIDHNRDSLAIGAKVRMALPSLSTTERLIAEWFLCKGNLDVTTSIKYVAEHLDVSEALIVKLSKKLGFAGFRELRHALVEYLHIIPYETEREVGPKDSVSLVLSKVFANSIQSLKEALSIADPNLIEQAARLISNSRQIILFGVGGSSSVCHDFEHKLLRIGLLSRTYDDFHKMLMVSSQLTEQDVVIAISQSGETTEIVKATTLAKQYKSKIICITNNDLSSLAQLADIAIFSPARGGLLLGQNAVARVIQLNLLDVLFLAILLEDYDLNREALSRSSKVVRHLRSKSS
jgi:DNA-binding MurR/RpiR family transcriptional regulator